MKRPPMRRVLVVAVAFAVAPVLGSAEATASDGAPQRAHAAGEDSPWPRTSRLRPNLRAVRREVNRLERQVELMELSVARFDDWETCLRYVPVSEYGDPWYNRYGYLYDAREGTGAGFMDALAVDRRSRPRREDYMFIDFDRRRCRSEAPVPGGTAEPASLRSSPGLSPGPAVARPLSSQLPQRAVPRTVERAHRASASAAARRGGLRKQMTRLERRARTLLRRAQVLHAASERFDEWESCVSWVPVTEQGGVDHEFGYLFGRRGQPFGYRPALHIDRSDWDDPDYMFLALVGGDRPGRSCQDEPGEAVD